MDKERLSQFAEKVFVDLAGTMTAGMAYLGVATGLFQVMAGRGPLTIDAVTEASGLQRRYVEEWLGGMAAGGYLDYDPAQGTFALPEEHAYLLASEGTDHYVGGLYYAVLGNLSVGPRVARAFREGGGVPFDDFPEEFLVGLDLMNRGAYDRRLVGEWLQEMPDAVKALESGGSSLDVGCGVGRVSLNLARAYPNSRFVGVDVHGDSIASARAAAEAEPETVGGRLTFVRGSLEALERGATFDLITACDCVHDFASPEETLGMIRDRLTPGGSLLVIEPKVADKLEDNINSMGAMFYGFSLFHCMTQSLAQGGPGLGTCMGPARTEALMRQAGFTQFRALPIRSRVNLFYEVKA
ncbi:MAG: methyltransferase domain-containing protein [SAR324 cluster bacterium]|nr:methyltransferase domain-containing protein [SAR324 cluster bacterium]